MPRKIFSFSAARILKAASEAGRGKEPLQSAAKKRVIEKQLDPTKLAASKLRFLPIVDPKQPIQGKRRELNSQAFKEFASREERRIQKALNALTHGRHIFAYQHVRTKQVVYSLTRYLEEHNVLSQMVNHGKKTVPATVRRDMWVPFYSVHFGDARLGLPAYRLLREFALQRQLAPPAEMITVTEEYLASKRPTDPTEAEEFDEKNKRRIGQIMGKRERAQVLMNQKATSVADIAAVLAIQEENIKNGLLEKDGERGKRGPAARRRLRETLKRQAEQAERNAARIANLEKALSSKKRVYKIAEEPSAYPQDVNEVKILWRDIHDAHHAKSWPNRVQHAELLSTKSHIFTSEKWLEGSGYAVAHDEPKEQTQTEQNGQTA